MNSALQHPIEVHNNVDNPSIDPISQPIDPISETYSENFCSSIQTFSQPIDCSTVLQ